MPRYGSAAEVRWFTGPPSFAGHTCNAFEADGKICFDLFEADGNGFAPVVPAKDGSVAPPGSVTTRLVRWRIDYGGNNAELSDREVLAVVNGEGPISIPAGRPNPTATSSPRPWIAAGSPPIPTAAPIR